MCLSFALTVAFLCFALGHLFHGRWASSMGNQCAGSCSSIRRRETRRVSQAGWSLCAGGFAPRRGLNLWRASKVARGRCRLHSKMHSPLTATGSEMSCLAMQHAMRKSRERETRGVLMKVGSSQSKRPRNQIDITCSSALRCIPPVTIRTNVHGGGRHQRTASSRVVHPNFANGLFAGYSIPG